MVSTLRACTSICPLTCANTTSEACRSDAVRYMSVPAGSQPPDRTDSHGHCPRSTLSSTNLKAGPASGSGRMPHGPRDSTPKAHTAQCPQTPPPRSCATDPGCRPVAGTSGHATPRRRHSRAEQSANGLRRTDRRRLQVRRADHDRNAGRAPGRALRQRGAFQPVTVSMVGPDPVTLRGWPGMVRRRIRTRRWPWRGRHSDRCLCPADKPQISLHVRGWFMGICSRPGRMRR